jgi:hypothetical protein
VDFLVFSGAVFRKNPEALLKTKRVQKATLIRRRLEWQWTQEGRFRSASYIA